MGIRIAIGAIIAVLLGGTGYFAQQSHSTKNQLQKREIQLSAEKDNTAKLNLRFKTIEQQMKGLQSRLDKEGTSAKTEIQEMSRQIAEKSASLDQEKAKVQNLEITLKQIQTTLDDERKARAEAEKTNQQNTELAGNRAEEIKRLDTQAKQMSQLITEKNTDIKQEKAEIRNLKTTHDIINSSLNNERRMRAEAEKANKESLELAAKRAEEIKRLESQAKEISWLITEKDTGIKQEKAKIRNFKTTLDIINGSLDNERKARTEAEKTNQQNIELAAKRAKMIKRLEATLKENQTTLADERKARTEAEKTNQQNIELAAKRAKMIKQLEATLKENQTTLADERKARAEAEKANKESLELAAKRAEEIKRLEAQTKEMNQFIAEKNAGLEQEKAKTRKLEIALSRIQASLKSDRKTQALVDKLSKQNLEFAADRAKEIKRLEKVREILETQVARMDGLIASEQKKAKDHDVTDKRNTTAKVGTEKAQNGELARKRAGEIARLEKTRMVLNTQVQEMSRLIAEKNAGIAREKTKAQNLELALNQIRGTLDAERKTRAKAEKANAQIVEFARNQTKKIESLAKAKELLGAQVQEMSQLIAEKTSVAELIKNKLDQTNLSLSETIKKHTLAIARSKILEKKAREEAERARKLESDLNELNKKLKKQFVSLQQTKDLLRVTIVNSLLFDSGSARLKEKGLEALLSVAEFLQKQKDKIIRVEGHTDNQPIKGNLLDRYPSNWELSFARAVSIVKFLESNNISPARMSATGHSFYRPVVSNDTGDGRAKNRRTDILLSNRPPKGTATTP